MQNLPQCVPWFCSLHVLEAVHEAKSVRGFNGSIILFSKNSICHGYGANFRFHSMRLIRLFTPRAAETTFDSHAL